MPNGDEGADEALRIARLGGISTVINALKSGLQKAEAEVYDAAGGIQITGYWVNDLMRIDIKGMRDK
jgi:hypothetical protein